jgi:hypothetical protein
VGGEGEGVREQEEGQKVVAPARSDPAYNPVFEILVDRAAEGQDTIVGIVAYSLYKLAKREWIAEFRETNGRPPTPEEIESYHKAWTPSLLEGKKAEATQIIASLSEDIVEKARPEILKEALRGSWWRATGINVFSNFLYTLIVLGVVLVVAITGLDIPALLQKLARVIQG